MVSVIISLNNSSIGKRWISLQIYPRKILWLLISWPLLLNARNFSPTIRMSVPPSECMQLYYRNKIGLVKASQKTTSSVISEKSTQITNLQNRNQNVSPKPQERIQSVMIVIWWRSSNPHWITQMLICLLVRKRKISGSLMDITQTVLRLSIRNKRWCFKPQRWTWWRGWY